LAPHTLKPHLEAILLPHFIGASALIFPLIIVTVGYIMACAVWPFASCRKCDGAGRHRSPSGRAWRYCHRCHGTGARLRTGRRVYNYLHRAWKDSHR
jgi:hypothetical protein